MNHLDSSNVEKKSIVHNCFEKISLFMNTLISNEFGKFICAISNKLYMDKIVGHETLLKSLTLFTFEVYIVLLYLD